MEDVKEDIRKKYPSLPPSYVSFAQLQERWLQQKQNQAEQKQKEEIESEDRQQPKKNNRISGSLQSSAKNSAGAIHGQSLHVGRNEEVRVDGNGVYVPRRQSDGYLRQARGVKNKWKSKKLELRDSGDAGGSKMGNAKENQKNMWPRDEQGLIGEDLVQALSGNGEISGVLKGENAGKESPGYKSTRVHEIVSTCKVELAPEIKENKGNPVGFRRKPRGKQVAGNTDSWSVEAKSCGEQGVDDHFSSCSESRDDAKSLGKPVVDDQFSNSSDSRRVEAKSSRKQVVSGPFYGINDKMLDSNYDRKDPVNGQFLSNAVVQGCVNEYKVEVDREALPENGFEDEVSVGLRRKNNQRYITKYEKCKRSDKYKGLLGEGNMCTQEVFQDNEEKEVPRDERRKPGKERLENRFQGNESTWKMNRDSNGRQLKLGQQPLEEDVEMGNKERTGPEPGTGKGPRACRNKDRVCHWIGRDFGDLSFRDSRNGNSSRGHRWNYGNFGISLHKKGKQVDSSLVWVKKGEKSDANADIS